MLGRLLLYMNGTSLVASVDQVFAALALQWHLCVLVYGANFHLGARFACHTSTDSTKAVRVFSKILRTAFHNKRGLVGKQQISQCAGCCMCVMSWGSIQALYIQPEKSFVSGGPNNRYPYCLSRE